jgi:uncharacterized protein YecT (DUF1311 family)
MRPSLLAMVTAISLGLVGSPALAVDRSSDARDFAEYVEVCGKEPGDRSIEACVADQVGSKTSYLGDILIETENALSAGQQRELHRSQKGFEAYRDATCRYQVGAHDDKDAYDQLFCTLRLTNQRIADVLEGVDFLDRKGD